jgi:3-hydroxyisobutyrate dehydrogenase-like beta-hydroxyacid dehydrogenase
MQFGFIGVGQMGGGLARNLIRAKKNVWVFDLNPEAVKETLAVGTTGRAAAKIEELAQADVVFTSLPLPQHLESVMLGPKGLLSQMKPGATYIDVSTIDPGTARTLSDAAEAKGIDFLECSSKQGKKIELALLLLKLFCPRKCGLKSFISAVV